MANRFPPLALAAVLALAGCGSNRQSTLSPHSKAAGEIATLWWVMLIGAWIVFGVVVMLLAVAFIRRRTQGSGDDRRARRLILIGGAVVPAVVLSALFALAIRTLPATSAPKGRAALTVLVVGHQWFWEVRYQGTDAVTANEIHIPARTPVRLEVRSADVIHSFWVPELNRKIDLIPGRTNAVLLRADRVGIYRGQCAEFCGLQHANMAFEVFADPPARFRAWLARQARPAVAGGEGQQVFLAFGCAACHTIRGTSADGDVGPDLTHIASRATLAAGTIPNNQGSLAAWIVDPQHIKPGNRMPALGIQGDQLQPLLAYLERLK
jgi:cytochrome c oxidase subunit II